MGAKTHEGVTGWEPSLRSSLSGHFHDLGKSIRIRNGHVGKDLTIQINPGLLDSVHQPAVRYVMLPGSCIDPRNPEAPECSLSHFTIPIGVPHGAVNRLGSRPKKSRPSTLKSSGQFQDRPFSLLPSHSSCDSRHPNLTPRYGPTSLPPDRISISLDPAGECHP